MLNSTKSGVPEKDKNVVADTAEVTGRSMPPHDQVWARSEPATREWPLASAPTCRS